LTGLSSIERLICARLDSRPDLIRVVLNPAGSWVALRNLRISLATDLAVEIDNDRSRAGRALVER